MEFEMTKAKFRAKPISKLYLKRAFQSFDYVDKEFNNRLDEIQFKKQSKRKVRNIIGKSFFSGLDKHLGLFANMIRRDLKNEKDCVIGITGYPGTGKSQFVTILGCLIDPNYTWIKNICFIPTADEIETSYMKLPMRSFFHIDEASRGIHKHQWHSAIQQKLNTLYDTEREGHYLCTGLIMPRFQNFTENFRNFRIKYWINVVERGLVIVYIRDEDKDCKDPWHLDDNAKIKLKAWKKTKLFERQIHEAVAVEQQTKNYFFYCEVPEIPKEAWSIYQRLKKESKETDEEKIELKLSDMSVSEKAAYLHEQGLERVRELLKKELTKTEIAVVLKIREPKVAEFIRLIEAEDAMKEKEEAIKPLAEREKEDLIKSNIKPIPRRQKKATRFKQERNPAHILE